MAKYKIVHFLRRDDFYADGNLKNKFFFPLCIIKNDKPSYEISCYNLLNHTDEDILDLANKYGLRPNKKLPKGYCYLKSELDLLIDYDNKPMYHLNVIGYKNVKFKSKDKNDELNLIMQSKVFTHISQNKQYEQFDEDLVNSKVIIVVEKSNVERC